MAELSERQFEFLKQLCENRVYFAIVPNVLETDPIEVQENFKTNWEQIESIITLGFFIEITDGMKESLKEAIEQTGRGFRAFRLSDDAIRMFSGPEGPVN